MTVLCSETEGKEIREQKMGPGTSNRLHPHLRSALKSSIWMCWDKRDYPRRAGRPVRQIPTDPSVTLYASPRGAVGVEMQKQSGWSNTNQRGPGSSGPTMQGKRLPCVWIYVCLYTDAWGLWHSLGLWNGKNNPAYCQSIILAPMFVSSNTLNLTGLIAMRHNICLLKCLVPLSYCNAGEK